MRFAAERSWLQSSIVSPEIHLIDDRTITIELRRADGHPMGKRLCVIVEASFDGVAWYPVNMRRTLVFQSARARIVFTLDVTGFLHCRLRATRKPPSDLLLQFVSS